MDENSRSLFTHTKRRIIDQKSLMTTIPTRDLLELLRLAEKNDSRTEKKD